MVGMVANTCITRPALRYFGGKWRIAPWLLKHLPEHDCYVEPFCGGASLLLRKAPAAFEVLNDLDTEVVTFFRMLRERPEELIRAIELTPWSRAEYDAAYLPVDTADDLERARLLYIRSHQSRFGGRAQWRQGWRFQRQPAGNRDAVVTWNSTSHLYAIAARLKQVQIECDDALAVIQRFDAPGTVHFVDPPYVPDSCGKRWRLTSYQHNLDYGGHRALAETLRACVGMVALCGYPSALYDALYPDWQRVERRDINAIAQPTTECLWLSPQLVRRQRQGRLALEVPA